MSQKFKRRRESLMIVSLLLLFFGCLQIDFEVLKSDWASFIRYDLGVGRFNPDQELLDKIENLVVKPKTVSKKYSRNDFSKGWGRIDNCDMRNLILARDLTQKNIVNRCQVTKGVLQDPYSGETINFYQASKRDEQKIEIEHIVAVSDAWQSGAQFLTQQERYDFYNDFDNLIAVGKKTNQDKSDADASKWLPPHKAFRCQYAAAQVNIKTKYKLSITSAEKKSLKRCLKRCP